MTRKGHLLPADCCTKTLYTIPLSTFWARRGALAFDTFDKLEKLLGEKELDVGSRKNCAASELLVGSAAP